MILLIAFLTPYVLIGITRIAYDFYHKDILSARYVKEPRIGFLLLSVLSWPFIPISTLIEQRRRIDLKHFWDFYFIPFFFLSWLYAAVVLGLVKIYSGEFTLMSEILRTILAVVIFVVIVWWFRGRRDKKIQELRSSR